MWFRYLSLTLVGFALVMPGCGKPAAVSPSSNPSRALPSTSEPTPAASSPNKAAATPANEKAPADEAAAPDTPIAGPTGRIEGTVKFVGKEIPKPTVVTNGTDPDICGKELSKEDVVISPETHGIRYVLVWLEDVKLPEGYKPPAQDLVLDNTQCQFQPHAAAITVGSTIETINSDNVYHTTNLFGAASENIPLISKGASHKTKARRAGTIGVKCDKHGWMQAFVRVDPHPFHAVTDADGEFAIAGVPVGTYKLKTWHETFFAQDFEVTVKENEAATMEVKYPTPEKP